MKLSIVQEMAATIFWFFKNQPLVIVITASAHGQYYAHTQVTEMLSKYILPAVIK